MNQCEKQMPICTEFRWLTVAPQLVPSSGPALDNWRPYSLCSRADPVAGVRGFVPPPP